MSSGQLTQRWDTFLGKLKDRFNDILTQTDSPLDEIISGLQFDTVPIHNVLNGLKYQTVEQLSQKGEEGWSKMQAELIKSIQVFSQGAEYSKLTRFIGWMNDEFMRFEVKTYAKAARKVLENVKSHIDEKKIHRCTQCAGELNINVYSFNAINIKCESCGSVNTYQPDDRIRAMEYYVINHLAEEQAIEEKIRGQRDKSAMKEYYRKYYGFMMENIPDKKELYERDLNERINNPFFS
ncbi:MAG: hypothetical protein OZ913_05130 [Ignavibacteriaceae bacterium]|jgi:hypothetical protein|nr:MAG: hypothetical protein UZ04_CHB001001671 [Chlorobi bacterium OLB4]MBW7855919.1 hypothetical protein [Ignavibacteria bacterium]MEB2329666.1 hypothetical protein [Ignavibacteriaceae bacterium]OQY77284.1 MAG: hypothetical protein B6D43_06655 [Ignavibacteriales bacterium UTCHB1]